MTAPTPQALRGLALALARDGAAALASVSLPRRLEVWSETVEAFLDPESDERRLLFPTLVESSRLSPEGLCEACDVILGGVREAPARALAESWTPEAPIAAAGGYAGVVLAANVPALAVQTLLPALLAGRPLLLKSPSSEPLFAPAFVAALARREPALGEAFAAVRFRGDERELVEAAFGEADRVVAYGGGDAIDALSAILGGRLVAQGPKASVALVSAAADSLLVARKLARDVALFDQRGCLSVQAIFTSGDAAELADALAWSLALEHRRLPPGPIDPAAAAAVQQVRGEAALRGLAVADLRLEQGTIVVETDSAFRPSPGLRTVRIHPVSTLRAALGALAPWRGSLQGAALAGEEAWALADELTGLGLSRLAQPGGLQLADAGWKNGGIDPRNLFE